jgi:beta-glucosidase
MKRILLLVLLFAFSVNAEDNTPTSEHSATVPVYRAGKWRGYDRQFENNVKAITNQLEKGDAKLLFVGDSITERWSDTGKSAWDKYYGKRKAVNLGLSGDRTQNVLFRLAKLPLDKVKPNLIVLMVGVNNIITQYDGKSTPEDTANGIKAIAAMLQKHYPDTKILVVNTLPTGENADNADRKKIEEINSYLPALFKDVKNVTLLDTNDVFLDENKKIRKNLMGDFVHPTSEGYELWAKAMESTIAKLFGDN